MRRVLARYVAYYHEDRAPRSVKDTPEPRGIEAPEDGKVVALPRSAGFITGSQCKWEPCTSHLVPAGSALKNFESREPLCPAVGLLW